MPTSSLSVVIQHLQADLKPNGDGMTDGELLARFLRSRDEDALAALVQRHASMAWGVCRRLLNHHDAEDAFQATFLVLVRKAADVPGQAVANWLYGVARQTAVRLRATAAKRGRREKQVVNMPEPGVRSQGTGVRSQENADLERVVDEELSRLPDHYRGVIVLCDLEGMTRKEAARQLGIPEGSVASRLARARVMVAKRLTRRGIVLSGGSVAPVLSAGSASASAPPALVVSTIEAASLLAAGQAAGVVSAKVAALTEGTVKAMFATRIKSALAVVLVVGLALAGGAALLDETQAADQPQAKGEPSVATKNEKKGEEKPAPPAKSDRERMVGNWFITNDDSLRKGEMWVITEDTILMHAKNLGLNAHRYSHRLDAGKDPKQIDITITRGKDQIVGVIKGIYVLDGDELRLCLGAQDKDRPAAFPKKPGPGEVLILQRETSGASPPKAKAEQPAKTDQERMVGNWFIMNEDSKRKGEMWVITEDSILMHALEDGLDTRRFAHRLDASKNPRQIDINVNQGKGSPVRTIKGIYLLDGDELRLCLGQLDKDRPAAFPEKPGLGEVLILQRAISGATPPPAKKELPAQTDQERMVGDWVITNADSNRKGEPWLISKDTILPYPNHRGYRVPWRYRLDPSTTPKQIDLLIAPGNGPPDVKGIYVLEGDELRLCLGESGKDRPMAFPKKPGPGEVLILQRETSPKAKEAKPAKTDQERMVGDWVIANADSKFKTDMTWTITNDRIHRHSNIAGFQMQWYHRLDASKDPRQIDIAGQLNGAPVHKSIYMLDGDELRLCLGDAGKDRPAAFPEKPKPGEVTILKRQKPDAEQPKGKGGPPAVKTERKVLTPGEAIKQRQEKVTVHFKITMAQSFQISKSNVVGEPAGTSGEGCYLKDGDGFSVQLLPPVMDAIRRLGIDPDKHFNGKVIQVTGSLQAGPSPSEPGQFQIVVSDLTQLEVLKE